MELHDKMELELNGFNVIRSSIYVSYGMVAGVAALAFAIRSLLKKRNGRRYSPSIFLISLLLCDVIQLISSFLLLLYLEAILWYGQWRIIPCLWLMSLCCGLVFHQMVALEWILSLTRPSCFSCLRSNCCSFPISLFVWVFYSVPVFISMTSIPIHASDIVFTLGFLVAGLVAVGISITTWILSALKPPFSDYLKVLSVSTFTLVVPYGPFVIVLIIILANQFAVSEYVFYVTVSLTYLKLISDPVLCVLVSMRPELQN